MILELLLNNSPVNKILGCELLNGLDDEEFLGVIRDILQRYFIKGRLLVRGEGNYLLYLGIHITFKMHVVGVYEDHALYGNHSTICFESSIRSLSYNTATGYPMLSKDIPMISKVYVDISKDLNFISVWGDGIYGLRKFFKDMSEQLSLWTKTTS
jgi:hypothetical protein